MATVEPLPAKVNLKLYRGDTRVWEDTFTEADGVTPIDLTGWNFRAQIRGTTDATTVMASITVDIANPPTSGVIRRTLTADEARKLVVGTATWDLEATLDDGSVRTFMAGKVTVLADTSRT